MILDVVKVILPAVTSFLLGLAITPPIADFLYRNKVWKKKVRTLATDGRDAKIFSELHKDKEIGTPRMGGVVIWGAVLLTTILFFLLGIALSTDFAQKLNFFSRNQTWLALFTLLIGALIGLADDWWVCRRESGYFAGGVSLKTRIILIALVGLVGGWWFYFKLGVGTIHIPFNGDLSLGILFIPIFILIMLATYSGGVIDGLDGLSGGVFAAIFSGYSIIAFFHNQIDLAAFCGVIVGGILAFLWFNIPPARFYNTETGIMALTTTLTVVAFLTGEVLVLPVIAFPLVLASASAQLQLLSKKLRGGKKIFLVAPIHHHFEAIGWPSYKVTMRFWIIAIVSSLTGTILALLG